MRPLSLVGAVVGGSIGALVWTCVAYWFNLEIGYVAGAIGGRVGFGSYALGGRGVASGVACALVTLIAIFSGKCLTAKIVLEAETCRQLHSYLLPQSEQFVRLDSEAEYPQFMVEYGYTTAREASQVPAHEVDNFTALVAPMLVDVARNTPTLVEWKATSSARAYVTVLTAGVPVTELVMESLGFIDLIFLVLGVGTAFKVGCARREDEFGGDIEERGEAQEETPEREPKNELTC